MSIPSQMHMSLVGPGGKPSTPSQKSMVSFSEHIIHLLTGGHTYDPPTFPIVLAWNDICHYAPTYLVHPQALTHWRLSIVNRHITEECNMFSNVEPELDVTKR